MEFVCNDMKQAEFVFPDKREMVEEDKAVELLDALIPALDAPTKLDLSNKSYSDAAAVKIAECLAKITSLTDVDIHDMIAGRPEEEALRSFTAICDSLKQNTIKSLNISDNALGAKGVAACRDLMAQSSLKSLYVLNNGISEAAAELIHTVLFEEGSAPTLSVFNFYNNMCGNGGAAAVAKVVEKSPTLVDLRYSATRSNAEGMALIATSILNLTHLVRLDLADNTFGAEVGEQLAEGIKQNRSLEYLNLRDAALDDEGAQAIVEALKNSDCIAHLDLSGNDLTEDFMADEDGAVRTVVTKPTLQRLFLDDNEFGTEGARILAGMLVAGSSALKTLGVCACEVTAAGAMALAEKVCAIDSMELLLLDGNEVCERGVEKVATLLDLAGKALGDMEDNDDDGEDDLGDDESRSVDGDDNDVDELGAALEGAVL